mmetsp:Transcript_99000/g.275584  ORF Transcript_99000/g.275584 Transcript_99000/m.275584 type:complete len:212 (-) Transcript_99000:1340-1975(-)
MAPGQPPAPLRLYPGRHLYEPRFLQGGLQPLLRVEAPDVGLGLLDLRRQGQQLFLLPYGQDVVLPHLYATEPLLHPCCRRLPLFELIMEADEQLIKEVCHNLFDRLEVASLKPDSCTALDFRCRDVFVVLGADLFEEVVVKGLCPLCNGRLLLKHGWCRPHLPTPGHDGACDRIFCERQHGRDGLLLQLVPVNLLAVKEHLHLLLDQPDAR